jgi:AAHS family 4-hydroxybenzoate transporter-like MFS transporter
LALTTEEHVPEKSSELFARSRVDIAALIDRSRLGAFQLRMLLICGLCLIMDGFDVQAMGYVAPALLAEWSVPRAALGPVFGAGLLGMLVGSLVLSVVADRFGRRPVLIGATLFFSLCMLLTPQAGTVGELMALRFITGLGLGGIMPNAMALAGEYSPRRVRVTVMMVISCGFTVGAALGGFISVALIESFGWRAVFYFGGAVPLILAILMIFQFPESLQLMVLRGKNPALVHRWLQRIDPSVSLTSNTELMVHEPVKGGAPIVELFREGRAGVTVLLWIINFMNLIDLYFLSNWLPTIVNAAGYSQSTAVLAGTALQVGGTIGTLAMGRIIDRVGFRRVLVPSFLLAAVTIALVGQPGIGIAVLFAAITIAGFCIVGGQPAVNALAASYYPTSLRATGVGWSLGIGRFGSILGPVVGGALIGLQWPNSWLFMAAAVPALISGLMMVCLGFWNAAGAPAQDVSPVGSVANH